MKSGIVIVVSKISVDRNWKNAVNVKLYSFEESYKL
jgi:hypothetical protein